MTAQLGGDGRRRRPIGNTAMPRSAPAATRALLRDIEDHTSPEGYGLLDVWMSHGDRVETLPPGFQRHRRDRQCPAGRHRRRGPRLLRAPVPPGGHPHPPGRAHPGALRPRDLRLRPGSGPRATSSRTASRRSAPRSAATRSCSGSPAGWTPPWSPPCCTAPSATSSPASSWTTACCAWARAIRSWPPSPATWGSRSSGSTPRSASSAGCRGHGPGAEAQDHRQHLHRGLRRRGRPSSPTSDGWPRAPSTRT